MLAAGPQFHTLPPPGETALAIRAATPADFPALRNFSATSSIDADLSLRIERGPEFFLRGGLHGERHLPILAEAEDVGIIGSVRLAERALRLGGRLARTFHLSDLRIDSRDRAEDIADRLFRHAVAVCERIDPAAYLFVEGFVGDRFVARFLEGGPRLPVLAHVATIRMHAVLPFGRPPAPKGIAVHRAESGDLAGMAEFWQRVARRRQLAPELDAGRLESFVADAPGLEAQSYLVARRAGQIEGFLGLWAQAGFSEFRVLRDSAETERLRHRLDRAAPLYGAPRLPAPGALRPGPSVVHLCVPASAPEVLQALLAAAYDQTASQGSAVCYTIGVDVRDPLRAALHGFRAFPIDLGVSAVVPRVRPSPPVPEGRPVHFETSLV
jgi:hypothetical protein